MTEEARDKRVASWAELLGRSIELGLGAAILTAESAQKLVNDMVARGHVAKEDSHSLVDRLLAMGRQQREMLNETVENTTERMMERMNLARQDELDALRRRIEVLESLVPGCAPADIPPSAPLPGEDFEPDQQ